MALNMEKSELALQGSLDLKAMSKDFQKDATVLEKTMEN